MSLRARPFAVVSVVLLACARTASPTEVADDVPKQVADIYRALVRVIGSPRCPELRVEPGIKIGFYYNKRIVLADDLHEKVKTLADPEAALAFVLAHELAHYHERHGWIEEFANKHPRNRAAHRLKAHEQLKMELDADRFALFWTGVAGYDTASSASRVLEHCYKAYDVEDDGHYPSLRERQQVLKDAAGDATTLRLLFDTGNLLLVAGAYRESAVCFRDVGHHFPSREILNNTGVALANQAVLFLPDNKPQFLYPFVLDVATRLHGFDGVIQRSSSENAARVREYARAARLMFEWARFANPDYAPAVVNLACTYCLEKEPTLAAAFADKAVRLARSPATREAAQVVLAIARWLSGGEGRSAAKEILEPYAGERGIAWSNLEVMSRRRGFATQSKILPEPLSNHAPERIAQRSALETDRALAARSERIVVPTPDRARALWPARLIIRWDRDATRFAARVRTDARNAIVTVVETAPGYQGASARGIRIGTTRKKLLATYRGRLSSIQTTRGAYYHYPIDNIAFRVESGVVVSWMIYAR